MAKRIFIECSKCGKRIIERKQNGLWYFCFGRPRPKDKDNPTQLELIVPIEMLIHGSVKMKCIRKSCRIKYPDHWNILNYFPGTISTNLDDSAIDMSECSGIDVD